MSAEFRLSDEEFSDALVYALVDGNCDLADREPGQRVWDDARDDVELLLPIIAQRVASEREAARAEGWNEARAELLPMLDVERAAERALVERIEAVLDQRIEELIYPATSSTSERTMLIGVAKVRAALTRPDTEGESDA